METIRLTLDAPLQADFNRFFEIHADPQTNLFNPEGPMDAAKAAKAFAENLEHWDKHRFGSCTISEKESGEIVGFGGLNYRFYGDELKINLGYRFAASAWGKGYATELSLEAIRHGFQELNLPEIWAVVRPDHEASIRVLEKCGLKLAGTLNDVACGPESLVYHISS